MRIPRTLSISQIFFCIFDERKSSIFVFCEFLEDFKLLENRNNIFESSSIKAFLRQSFGAFEFSNLASHSRYFQSVTLKSYKVLITTRRFGQSPASYTDLAFTSCR